MYIKEVAEHWAMRHKTDDIKSLSGNPAQFIFDWYGIERPSGKVFLDIGIGQAQVYNELIRDNKMVCVDICQEALARTPKATTHLTPDMVSIPDGSVDIAIMHLVAQHNNDETLAFMCKEVYRALAPGGVFYFQFAESEVLRGLKLEVTDAPLHYNTYRSPLKVKQLLNSVGITKFVMVDKRESTPARPDGIFYYNVIIQK